MLVLSRKRDEAILIGDDVKITIVDIRGDKVRLGIEAPKEVPVYREEIYELIRKEAANVQSLPPPPAPVPAPVVVPPLGGFMQKAG